MERLALPQPQLVDEAEALLGVPFFFDDTDDFEYSPEAEDIGLRSSLYRSAIRLIAETRHKERAKEKKRPQYSGEKWNEQWRLTPRKLGEIALQEAERTNFLARQLYLANSAEMYLQNHWEELSERLRDDQLEYIMDIPHAIHQAPRVISDKKADGSTERHMVRSTTVIAPTGFGKTRIIETCIKMFQPGEEPEYTRTKEKTRVLVIEPSVALVDQTANELQQALPNTKVGRVRSNVFQPTADVVVITIDMFNALFKNNKLHEWNVDVIIPDEGHHAVEPQLYNTLISEWEGHTIFVTATPAYDEERDIRKISSQTIEKRSITDSMDEGVLNDAEVYTFIINSDVYQRLIAQYELPQPERLDRVTVRDVIDYLVVDFVTPLLEEGRRGIIFCEQGNEAYFARQLAGKLRDVRLSNGDFVAADAVYSAANNQEAVIKKFHEGKSQVLVTVDTGREGLNAAFDFVIANCNIISQLRGRQIAGRGTRKSDDFPSTVYGQFHIGDILDSRMLEKSFSLEHAFGRTELSQGRQKQARDNKDDQQERKSRAKPGKSDVFSSDSKFSFIVQDLLDQVENRPIGELFVGVERGLRKVREGSIALPEIIEGYDTTEQRAKRLLRQAGFRWQARYEKEEAEGSSRKLVHYYSEEARDYLRSIIGKEPDMLSEKQVADRLDVPVVVVKHVADNEKNNITGQRIARPKGKAVRSFDSENYAALKRIIEKMPGVSEGSRPVKYVAEKLKVDEATAWKLAGASPDDGRYAFSKSYWMSAAEVARAEDTFNEVDHVSPGDKNIADISRSTGVERGVVKRNITSEEHAAAQNKRYRDTRGFLKEGLHWNAEQVEIIEARLEKFRPRKLGAHFITISAMNKLVAKVNTLPKEEWEAKLAEGGHTVKEMRITGMRTMNRCITWQALQHLVEIYGAFRGANAIRIDFSRLPLDEDDLDPSKVLYAQKIQSSLLETAELEEYTFTN